MTLPATATRIKPAAFTVGATVLRYQNHHDTAPTTETVKAVTSRTVTLESGEKFGSDGVAWGKGSDWFAPYIKAAPAATETHRNDPPALTRVEAFDYLGFACKYGRDRETRDWLMEVDGNPIGYAVSSSAADTTIREHCDAVLAHTRATTADMAADAAAFRAELAERAGPEWNCTPENPCDGECAEHSPAAALEDAGTAAEPWHRAAWREDWHQRHPATPARAASAQTPPTPPRPVAELREELERVTDAIHDRKAVGAGYARLHQQRSHIIAELDEAHKAEHKAVIKPCFTCGRQFISKGPRDILCSLCACPASGANTKSIAPADPLDADISTLGLSPEIERLLVGTPNPICSVCGAPATISFAHTWFCGEHNPCPSPPYAALSDAASVEPWIAQPAPSCGNCGQPHPTQRCPEVLALLLGDSDTVEVAAEGFALTKGFCRDALYTPEPVPVWLNALPSPDDPCAGVRALLKEALVELERHHRDAQDRADEHADDYAHRHGDDPSFQAGITGMMSYEVPEPPLLARIRAALG